MLHMNPVTAIPAAAWSTLSAGTVLVIEDFADGPEPSTLTTGAVFAAGAAVIAGLWRAWRKDQADASAERRSDDERRERELARLRRRNDQLIQVLVTRGLLVPDEEQDDPT